MAARRKGAGAGLLLLALTTGAVPVSAQGVGSFTLALDNDGLNVWMKPSRRTDRFYTHGARLEWTLGWRPPGAGRLLGQDLATCGEADGDGEEGEEEESGDAAAGACLRSRVRVVQRIYTPQDVFFFHPGGDDRPYGGWLGATVAAERVTPGHTTSLSVELGVTGEPSLARQLHLKVHSFLDKHPPQGWEHQIPFEVAGAATWREERRWPATALERDGPDLFGATHWRGTLGTVRTSAAAGIGGAFRWNAPPDGAGSGSLDHDAYVLVRLDAEAELVARDAFLDGSLWHDGDSVTRNPLLGRLRLHIRMGVRGFGVVLGATRTSREFRGQRTPHTYSTLGVVFGG